MTAKHTPLPWFVKNDTGFETTIKASGGIWIGNVALLGLSIDEAESNAEFIVRACNSHYDLIEALEEALNQLKTNDLVGAYTDISNERINMLSAAQTKAKAALAKARGEA